MYLLNSSILVNHSQPLVSNFTSPTNAHLASILTLVLAHVVVTVVHVIFCLIVPLLLLGGQNVEELDFEMEAVS